MAGSNGGYSVEHRVYFLVGDVVANGGAGVATAWLVTAVVDPSWHMLVAMLAGMAVAMVLSIIVVPVFVALFGAMEVMLPVMLSAMVAGMVFGMSAGMHVLTTPVVVLGGGLVGLLVLSLTYAADVAMHGRSG
jgi:hypothetical protein